MKSVFSYCLLLLTFSAGAKSLQTTTTPIDCDAEKLEQCTQDLMKFGSDDIDVPSNEQQVLDSCSVIKNGTRCIRRYMSNCAPSVIRQMTKMAMSGVSKSINKRCSPQGIQSFLSHRDCIVAVKKPAQDCYQGLVRDLYRIKGSSDNNLLHPAVCCFISKMHECNSIALKQNCREDSQEYYGQETGKLMDEMMELICPSNLRWGRKDCEDVANKLPDSGEGGGEDSKESILPLVMDLMKRLAE